MFYGLIVQACLRGVELGVQIHSDFMHDRQIFQRIKRKIDTTFIIEFRAKHLILKKTPCLHQRLPHVSEFRSVGENLLVDVRKGDVRSLGVNLIRQLDAIDRLCAKHVQSPIDLAHFLYPARVSRQCHHDGGVAHSINWPVSHNDKLNQS
jgi:hypothetical protein